MVNVNSLILWGNIHQIFDKNKKLIVIVSHIAEVLGRIFIRISRNFTPNQTWEFLSKWWGYSLWRRTLKDLRMLWRCDLAGGFTMLFCGSNPFEGGTPVPHSDSGASWGWRDDASVSCAYALSLFFAPTLISEFTPLPLFMLLRWPEIASTGF